MAPAAMAQPAAAKPEAMKPEAPKVDTVKSEPLKAEPARTEAMKPESGKPDALKAESSRPDAARMGANHSAAIAACERAARQTLGARAAPAVEITFNAPPAIQPGLPSDPQTLFRGAGRWRSATGSYTFSYSCNVDLNHPEAVGLVMRDSSAGAAPATPATAPVEPDLRALSPGACESKAVESLQQRWPQVSNINFDSATRTFRQQSATHAVLHGTGRALPTPGAAAVLFGFECAVDPRDGRVLSTSISG